MSSRSTAKSPCHKSAQIIDPPPHTGPQCRPLHLHGKGQESRREINGKEPCGQIKHYQSHQEWSAKLYHHYTYRRKQHDTVHDNAHVFSFSQIKNPACCQSAARKQKTRPLPDIHSTLGMCHSDCIIKCCKNAGHQRNEYHQQHGCFLRVLRILQFFCTQPACLTLLLVYALPFCGKASMPAPLKAPKG